MNSRRERNGQSNASRTVFGRMIRIKEGSRSNETIREGVNSTHQLEWTLNLHYERLVFSQTIRKFLIRPDGNFIEPSWFQIILESDQSIEIDFRSNIATLSNEKRPTAWAFSGAIYHLCYS